MSEPVRQADAPADDIPNTGDGAAAWLRAIDPQRPSREGTNHPQMAATWFAAVNASRPESPVV